MVNYLIFKWLYLDNNELKELPKEIGKLSNLYALYLENNKLIKVPKEIAKLSNLRELRLRNNELSSAEKIKTKSLFPNAIL